MCNLLGWGCILALFLVNPTLIVSKCKNIKDIERLQWSHSRSINQLSIQKQCGSRPWNWAIKAVESISGLSGSRCRETSQWVKWPAFVPVTSQAVAFCTNWVQTTQSTWHLSRWYEHEQLYALPKYLNKQAKVQANERTHFSEYI